jgi:hypothetical protein
MPFIEVLAVWYKPLTDWPRVLMMAIETVAIRASIIAYSTMVAPFSLLQKKSILFLRLINGVFMFLFRLTRYQKKSTALSSNCRLRPAY